MWEQQEVARVVRRFHGTHPRQPDRADLHVIACDQVVWLQLRLRGGFDLADGGGVQLKHGEGPPKEGARAPLSNLAPAPLSAGLMAPAPAPAIRDLGPPIASQDKVEVIIQCPHLSVRTS